MTVPVAVFAIYGILEKVSHKLKPLDFCVFLHREVLFLCWKHASSSVNLSRLCLHHHVYYETDIRINVARSYWSFIQECTGRDFIVIMLPVQPYILYAKLCSHYKIYRVCFWYFLMTLLASHQNARKIALFVSNLHLKTILIFLLHH